MTDYSNYNWNKKQPLTLQSTSTWEYQETPHNAGHVLSLALKITWTDLEVLKSGGLLKQKLLDEVLGQAQICLSSAVQENPFLEVKA